MQMRGTQGRPTSRPAPTIGESRNKHIVLVQIIENLSVIVICLIGAFFLFFSIHHLYRISEDRPSELIVGDEYYTGYNFYTRGGLSLDDHPSLLRPPGYPFLVALSLFGRDILQSFVNNLHLQVSSFYFEDFQFLVVVNLIILMVGGFCLYKTLRRWINILPAVFIMLAYLINPITYCIVRTLNYYTLDYVQVTILLGICAGIICKHSISLVDIALRGLVFAIACLIRPVFLISPMLVFILLWLLRRLPLMKTLILTAVFSVTMLGAILPYSFRNLAVSGRFILISNQGPFALWGNAVVPFMSVDRLPEWSIDVWYPYGVPICEQTIGITAQDFTIENLFYENSVPLSDAFEIEFFKQLKEHPFIYLGNVINNFLQYITYPGDYFEIEFWELIPKSYLTQNERLIESLRDIFGQFLQVCTFVLLLLLIVFTCRKSLTATLGLIFLGYMAASYSFTILVTRYLYNRIPVLLFCFAVISDGVFAVLKKRHSRLSIFNPVIAMVIVILASLPVMYVALLGK